MAIEYSNQYDVQQILAEEALAKEQAYLTNAVSLAGTPGAGMMMRAQGVGRREGEAFAGLGRMLTGESVPVDPRVAKQDALMKIFEEYGEPENYEDMVKIANVLRVNGFPGEANLAMKEASQFKTDETNRMNATSSATTANTKAPVRDDVDYVKIVDGKQVIYTKTVQYNTETKQWDFIQEAPKYNPEGKTALGKDLLLAAKTYPNKDGTKGCNLDDDVCYMYSYNKVQDAKGTESAFDKVVGEAMGDELVEVRKEALTAFKTIGIINNSFNSLNSAEVVAGFAASPRLAFQKALGFISGSESENVQATELWLASTAGLVTEIMGSGDLGAGTGLSDNDIKFAKAMVAGDIGLNEGSVRRILWMRRILEVEKIKRWNERYENVPEALKDTMASQALNRNQAVVDIPTWDQDMVYLRPPKGHVKLKDSNEVPVYYWPANPKYDINTISYTPLGETEPRLFTIHDKNGFDITPKQGN